MFLDRQTLLTGVNPQALTTGTIVSTDIYDTGAAEDAGIGMDINCFLAVTTAFAGGTSVAITLQTATDAAFTSPVALGTVTFATAALTLGAQLYLPVVPAGTLRFLRFSYAITGTYTAGAIRSGFVMDRQAWQPVAGNQPV